MSPQLPPRPFNYAKRLLLESHHGDHQRFIGPTNITPTNPPLGVYGCEMSNIEHLSIAMWIE
eukprot:scaffold3408_cov129-Amphora_coffeaeformis.AAC.12